MKTTEIPTDDPLEIVWAVREKIYEDTKDMTHEEFSEYLQESSEWFNTEIEKRRKVKQNSIAAGITVKKIWEE